MIKLKNARECGPSEAPRAPAAAAAAAGPPPTHLPSPSLFQI
ncbi:unnamed protein product [Plutella xylostella]|uniref:(diamondback moth) hypothetical protein n=1 Tax=Plutella xylostella TaxID=51655 RepID=A0A8S4GDF8_PLUXY|nr:unnamed protein product [Plutella xylostella]